MSVETAVVVPVLYKVIGFVGGSLWSLLAAIGFFHVKSDNEFRRIVHKKIGSIEKEMHDKHEHILKNHPDKDDFNRLYDTVTDGFKDLKKEIREK